MDADRDALEAWHSASIGAAATEAAQQVDCGEEDVDFEMRVSQSRELSRVRFRGLLVGGGEAEDSRYQSSRAKWGIVLY